MCPDAFSTLELEPMKNTQLTKPTTIEATEAAPMENGPLTRRKAVSRAAGALAAVAGLLTFRRIQASKATVSLADESELVELRGVAAGMLEERRALLAKYYEDHVALGDQESELHEQFWVIQDRINDILNGW
jgi:hypothetical protein